MRVVTVMLASAVVAVAGCSPQAAAHRDTATVAAIVDGDTIDVAIGGRDERVRLIGIDTPETHVEDGPPECFGPEASDFTASLLPVGTAVRLERDVVGRDDYGRLLAYVYRLDDDVLINEVLLRQGFARPMTIAPNDAFARRFVATTFAAEADGLGLWTACAG